MTFRTYIIGRSRDADFRVLAETVSRSHAELTITSGGRYYLTDRNSMHGTWIRRDREWQKHSQGYVELGEAVRFGQVETRLRELVGGKSLNTNHRPQMQGPVSANAVDRSSTGDVQN